MAAKRSYHSTGFFSDLNKLSWADFYPQHVGCKKKKTLDNGRLFNVERVITSRRSKDMDEKEYLIKWSNYSPFEATWEPQGHLNAECLKYFENPMPDRNVVLTEVARLKIAVAYALKASRTRQKLIVEFRQDVYLHLFGGKGCMQGKWRVLDRDDFMEQYSFEPNQWDIILDQHGQGTRIHYPVKVRHFISWSPKGFIIDKNITEAPRAYQEKLSLKMVKVAS